MTEALGYRTETEGKIQRIIRISDGATVYERKGWPVDLTELIEWICEMEERWRVDEIKLGTNEWDD